MPVLLRSLEPIRRRTCVVTAVVVVGTLFAGPLTSDAAPQPRTAPAPIEVLSLDCEATTNLGDAIATDELAHDPTYGVACRWTVPTAADAAGVKLFRVVVASGTPRQQIFATRELTDNSHLDVPVRPDQRYAYRVQALSRTGHVVSSSRTVTVAVPSVEVEPLRLKCRAAASEVDARAHIGCKWTLPTEPGARTLTLWRSVDDGPRERVTSSHLPFASSYRDVVPAGTGLVVYAVIATDGAGHVVARSRADTLTIRNGPSDASAGRLGGVQIGRAD